MNDPDTIIYRIDANDCICYVNQAYDQFAEQNMGQSIMSEHVLGTSLWDHITDPTTEQIYRGLIARARAGQSIPLSIRCDSPDCRRFLNIQITAAGANELIFCVEPARLEKRPPQPLLQADSDRNDEVVSMCSWCKKIKLINDDWQEIEQGVKALAIFEQEALPMLSHGICPACKSNWKTLLHNGQKAS